MNDTTVPRVLAELTIDEASVLVGLARSQGLIELADKVQEAIMEASNFPVLHISKVLAENPILAVKSAELNKPDLVGNKDADPVVLTQTQTEAVDETAKLPLSTQTSASIAATSVIGANTDGEGSEA